MEYIVTIDVGTMSMRSILYDIEGNSLFTSTYEYHAIYMPRGHVEQDPADWEKGLQQVMTEMGQFLQLNSYKVAAISVTSQRASVIPVDREGRPLYNAITWQDKRSEAICDEMMDELSMPVIYRKTGLRANPYFSLPKMVWIKQEMPDIYAKTYKLIGVQDYVIYLLTGEFKTDWSQAARTMLMNIKTFKWSQEMLSVSHIDENMLCEMCAPGAIAGSLRKDFAKSTGFQPDVPVIMAGGDQQNAALALNILRPGYAEANTGTGSFVIAYSNKPVFDKKCRVLCSASAVPGKWIVEAGIFNTGAIYRWFKEQFYQEKKASYDMMNKEAAISPTGANGVLLMPHFEGSAAPHWNPRAKGMFFNLSLGTTRGDMARSIFEGIAMEIADNFALIEDISGEIEQISVAGGMTKSQLFNQIQADVSYKPVIQYQNSEATSLGATMSAGVTMGFFSNYNDAFRKIVGKEDAVYKPNAENHIAYERLQDKKLYLYETLKRGEVYQKFVK